MDVWGEFTQNGRYTGRDGEVALFTPQPRSSFPKVRALDGAVPLVYRLVAGASAENLESMAPSS